MHQNHDMKVTNHGPPLINYKNSQGSSIKLDSEIEFKDTF